jgi:hypothetical protein
VVHESLPAGPLSGQPLGRPSSTSRTRHIPAIRVLAAYILALSVVGCTSRTAISSEEAIERAKACITPDPTIRYLPAGGPDFQQCLNKAMRASAGRRFLLDEGNAALAAWSADIARYVGDVVTDRPGTRLGNALGAVATSALAADASPRMGDFYRQLVVAAFAESKDRRNVAAEIAGILGSFVSQGPGKPADSFIRVARERLPDGHEDEVNRELARLVRHGMEQLVAINLWADERVRAQLLAGDPPAPPATAPPAATPSLEDPPGRLHIPGPHQQPAHSIFFNWYEHGGGLPLATAAEAATLSSRILDRFQR